MSTMKNHATPESSLPVKSELSSKLSPPPTGRQIDGHSNHGSLTVTAWGDKLDKWRDGVKENCGYEEEVWIYTEVVEGTRQCRFKVTLKPVDISTRKPGGPESGSESEPPNPANDITKQDQVLKSNPMDSSVHRVNDDNREGIYSPKNANIQASNQRGANTGVEGSKKSARASVVKPERIDFEQEVEALATIQKKDPSSAVSLRESANRLIRNQDLAASLRFYLPLNDSLITDELPAILTQDATLHSKAGIYGIVLRAALMGKVSCAKANLTLYINRLEVMQSLLVNVESLVHNGASSARDDKRPAKESVFSSPGPGSEGLGYTEKAQRDEAGPGTHASVPIKLAHRAYLMHSVWKLINEMGVDDKYISESIRKRIADGRPLIDALLTPGDQQRTSAPEPSDEKKHVNAPTPRNSVDSIRGLTLREALTARLWYFSRVTLARRVEKNNSMLTKLGHGFAFAAFASLLMLSWGKTNFWAAQDLLGGMVVSVLNRLPDGAGAAIIFAAVACCFYAITTQRLIMRDRAALLVNEKIEAALDASLADLMKGNMDVQIGRLGHDEPVSPIPEHLARRLDEAFAFKEMVNSYESSVRARLRHVAQAVGKAERIRADSQQRIRNAALGVTASFVLLEIGGRIQNHRDLLAGTDPQSYAYWLHRDSGSVHAGEGAAPAHVPRTSLDCARTEIIEQLPASSACLNEWRESALSSSSWLLLLVFFIAMVLFAVRVLKPSSNNSLS